MIIVLDRVKGAMPTPEPEAARMVRGVHRRRRLTVPTLVVFGRCDRPYTEELMRRICRKPERYADRVEFAYVDEQLTSSQTTTPPQSPTSRSTGSNEQLDVPDQAGSGTPPGSPPGSSGVDSTGAGGRGSGASGSNSAGSLGTGSFGSMIGSGSGSGASMS